MAKNTVLKFKNEAHPVADMIDVKSRMKATWEDGDYASFAEYMQPGAVQILENWQLRPKQHLLDIGCGSGQSAIPAAKHGHTVTGIDIAENLIAHAKVKAQLENLNVQFDVGDAEALPYQDKSYDVVISMIGAMFAPQPDRVVSEMARILRPGGKLYMANWTPQSMPAQLFKCVAEVTPPPVGTIPPVLWGDENTVQQRLEGYFDEIKLTRKFYPQWHYPFDADGIVNLFRSQFGPVKRAFDKLSGDSVAQQLLHEQLKQVYERNSETHSDGTTTITGGEYLEVSATRQAKA